MNYIISLSEAVDFVKAFVTNCKLVAENEALGGTIGNRGIDGRQKALTAGKQYRGNMAWFCHDINTDPENPELFLAFEETNEFEIGEVIDEPDNDWLIRPSKQAIFTYGGEVIETMLRTHQFPVGATIDQVISKADVKSLKEQYKKHSTLGTKLNIHPYGFFENYYVKEVELFLDQDKLEYVRYYFGYSDSNNYQGAKVRIVLVGVDKNGKNIVPINLNAKRNINDSTDDTPIILQKSWPPPFCK